VPRQTLHPRRLKRRWRVRDAGLFLVEIRRDHFAGVLARPHRDDLEGYAETPAIQDPLLQQPRVVAFHQLEAAVEVRLDPAPDISESLRKFDAWSRTRV
jgi:hypothetical protein